METPLLILLREESSMSDGTDRKVTILIAEQSAIVSKMGANEAWATGFVALYFAFSASIGTALGFILFQVRAPENSQPIHDTALDTLHIVGMTLSAIGFFLNTWAIGMVIDYKKTTTRLWNRLERVEADLSTLCGITVGIAGPQNTQYKATSWRVGTMVVVGSVLVLFFSPWIVIATSLILR